jgi:uncharacterized protein (TIGR03067 family)
MAIKFLLAKILLVLVPACDIERISDQFGMDLNVEVRMAYFRVQSAFKLAANLPQGKVDFIDTCFVIGDPTTNFVLGRQEIYRYSQYGFDLLVNHEGNVVGIRRIPPKFAASLPEKVKQEMKDLQGLWKLTREKDAEESKKDFEDRTSYIQIDGDRIQFFSAGVAPCFCFRINTTKNLKSFELYLPDPKDEEAFAKQDDFPKEGIYKLRGDVLTIRSGKIKDLKGFDGGDGFPAIQLERVNIGLIMAKRMGVIVP